MAVLKLVGGQDAGKVYHLEKFPCRLGRATDCELSEVFLGLPSVSRHHAEISLQEGKFFVRDTESRNGTCVNNAEISKPTELRNGDRLAVGGVEFDFWQDSDASSQVCYDSGAASHSTITSTIDMRVVAPSVEQPAGDGRLQAMVEMLAGLGGSLRVNEVLERALSGLLKVFSRADEAFVGLGDPTAGPPELVAANARRWTTSDHCIHVSRTVLEKAAQSKQAVLSKDALTDPRFDASESIHELPIRSFMCAPILDTHDQCLGVLQLNKLDAHHPFTGTDLKILVAITALIAKAIEYARLHQAALEKLAEERDLAVARTIQENLLPTKSPELPTYTFDQYYCAARQIGGDYFDYLYLPDGRLGIVVADACGKGVAAAVLISIVSGELKTALASRLSPVAALAGVNARLLSAECGNKFVTLSMTIIDTMSGELEVLNAGHFELIVRGQDGSLRQIGAAARGLPLGVDEDVVYTTQAGRLEPGESMVMFSDGLTDAMAITGDCYGLARLKKAVMATEPKNARELVLAIVDDVQSFVGLHSQVDDMCLVCVHRDGL